LPRSFWEKFRTHWNEAATTTFSSCDAIPLNSEIVGFKSTEEKNWLTLPFRYKLSKTDWLERYCSPDTDWPNTAVQKSVQNLHHVVIPAFKVIRPLDYGVFSRVESCEVSVVQVNKPTLAQSTCYVSWTESTWIHAHLYTKYVNNNTHPRYNVVRSKANPITATALRNASSRVSYVMHTSGGSCSHLPFSHSHLQVFLCDPNTSLTLKARPMCVTSCATCFPPITEYTEAAFTKALPFSSDILPTKILG